jgi:rhodanese-related sulfurtransferase
MSTVTAHPPASCSDAEAHFRSNLAFETDCWDVNQALEQGDPDFILVDVRSPNLFAKGHIPGAINIPHREMTLERMSDFPDETLFVVYCAGSHCNGVDKAGLRLARLGRPVKVMLGGIVGWQDEGFQLVDGNGEVVLQHA